MKDEYIKNYVDGALLRLSFDALWNHLSWPPPMEQALTMTEWGPFYLTGTNAPFVPIFIRTVDRALHHSSNVWRQLAEDLTNVQHMFLDLAPDARIQTADRASKYEIEAFLGAVIGVTENNLIHNKKRSGRLERSQGLPPELRALIQQEANAFYGLGIERKWRWIRNSAYHLEDKMHDWGFTASIRQINGKRHVELNGIYSQEGASPDLVQVFTETHDAFLKFATRIRNLLKDFAFANIAVPTNNHYVSKWDEFGNMLVGLGPNGFELRHYPQTAKDFCGPIRP